MKYRLSGKISLLWFICFALLVFSGIALVKKAYSAEKEAASVFTSGGAYEGANTNFLDLMG